jgi:hypothetical protein
MTISGTLFKPFAMVCQLSATVFRYESVLGQPLCSDNDLTRSGYLPASHNPVAAPSDRPLTCTLNANRLHEGGDVVGEQFHRIGPLRLIGLTSAARIDGDAGKALGVIANLEGVAGMIGSKIGDENKRLTGPLLLVVHGDAVGLDFRHTYLPGRLIIRPRSCGANCSGYQR